MKITPENLERLGVALAHQCGVPENDLKAIAGMVEMVRKVHESLRQEAEFSKIEDMTPAWSFMIASVIVSASVMSRLGPDISPDLKACDEMHAKVRRAIETLEGDEKDLASVIVLKLRYAKLIK